MSAKHLREFYIVDATDNSGYHTTTVRPRPPWGVNLIHVREVDPKADKLRDELVEALKRSQKFCNDLLNGSQHTEVWTKDVLTQIDAAIKKAGAK